MVRKLPKFRTSRYWTIALITLVLCFLVGFQSSIIASSDHLSEEAPVAVDIGESLISGDETDLSSVSLDPDSQETALDPLSTPKESHNDELPDPMSEVDNTRFINSEDILTDETQSSEPHSEDAGVVTPSEDSDTGETTESTLAEESADSSNETLDENADFETLPSNEEDLIDQELLPDNETTGEVDLLPDNLTDGSEVNLSGIEDISLASEDNETSAVLDVFESLEEPDEKVTSSLQSTIASPAIQAVPQYEIRTIGSDLYIVNTLTNEIRKDNAWVELDGKYYFPNADGNLYRSRWITFGPERAHYMGADGAAYIGIRTVGENLHLLDDRNMQRGVLRKDNAWVEYNGKEYFPNAVGNLYHDQIISFGPNNLYYLDSDGSKFNGDKVAHYGDRILLFGDNGKVKTPKVGWYDSGNKHYFASEKGEFYRNRWITFGPKVAHYMGADGAAYTGVRTVNGNLHLLDGRENLRGVLRKDNAWVDLDGKHYFPNADGNLYRNRWITFGPERAHYMGADGAAYIGVQTVGKNLHLLDDRNMQRGVLRKDNAWVEYKGKEYFPNADGNLYHDRIISFGPENLYYLDSDGSKFNGDKIAHYGDRILLFGDNGRPKTPKVGWYDSGNKHYFASEKGEFYRNRWITFGPEVAHFMGTDGAAYTGVRTVGTNLHLFDNQNMSRGVLRKDNNWVQYGGKEYFPNRDGNLYRDRVITVNDTLYYVDSTGSKLNSNKIISYNNRLYMFGKGGTVQKLNNWVSLGGSSYFVTQNGTLHTKSIRMINGQEYLFDADGRSSLTNSGYRYTVKLSTPWSSQLAPVYAPNGCEMASVLSALRYHGYDRGVTLPVLLAEMPRHSNPQYGFNTDPYKTALGTIYPNALLPTLQKYAPNSDDVSWSSTDVWRRVIDNGNPVVLWCTSGFRTPYYSGLSYPSNTHVQLITGYSLENNTFSLMDPYSWSSPASHMIVDSYTLANSNAWGGRYAISIR